MRARVSVSVALAARAAGLMPALPPSAKHLGLERVPRTVLRMDLSPSPACRALIDALDPAADVPPNEVSS